MGIRVSVGGVWVMRGLTLIELMVVVAVLAILATIAVPTYESYMRKVRRADGTTTATAVALAQERYFSVYQRYLSVSDNDAAEKLKNLAGLEGEMTELISPKGYYSWSVTGGVISGADCGAPSINRCFTVSIKPIAGKAQANDDKCTEILLDSTGVKDGKPSSTHECWGKR